MNHALSRPMSSALGGLLLCSLLLTAAVTAQVPQQLSYQGVLTNPAGIPLPDGPYDLSFSLYTADTGGTALWTESHVGVPLAKGMFGVTLGSLTPLSGVNFGQALYLGVTRGTDPEFSPRSLLTSTPSSLAPWRIDGTTIGYQAGNVGIGTVSPSNKLTVIGDANVIGSVGIGQTYPQATLHVRSSGTDGSTSALMVANGSGTPGLVVRDDQTVGIGTNAPVGGLHIVREPITNGGTLALEGSTHMYMSFFPYGLGAGRRGYFGYPGAGVTNLTLANENYSGNIVLATGAPYGKVGINVAYPTYALELPNFNDAAVGYARATGWVTYSSRRWKQNIRPIRNALDKVMRLDGVMFEWKEPPGAPTDIGFVAEDVGAVVPELVTYEPDGVNASGMKYDRVTALAVEAIKELRGIVDRQEKEIADLRELVLSRRGNAEGDRHTSSGEPEGDAHEHQRRPDR